MGFLFRRCALAFDNPVDGHTGYGVLMGQLVPGKLPLSTEVDNFPPLLLGQGIPLVCDTGMFYLYDVPPINFWFNTMRVLPLKCYRLMLPAMLPIMLHFALIFPLNINILHNHFVTTCYHLPNQSADRWRYHGNVMKDNMGSPLPPPRGVSQTLRHCPKWASHLIPHQTPCRLPALVPHRKRWRLPTHSATILLLFGKRWPVTGDGLF